MIQIWIDDKLSDTEGKHDQKNNRIYVNSKVFQKLVDELNEQDRNSKKQSFIARIKNWMKRRIAGKCLVWAMIILIGLNCGLDFALGNFIRGSFALAAFILWTTLAAFLRW